MKQMRQIFLVMLASCMALAAETKMLTMTVNSIATEELPFAIETTEFNGKDIVTAEVKENRHQLKLSAKKEGIAEIQVNGAGLSQKYRITVINDLTERLEELRLDLEAFPELSVNIRNHKLKVEGTISNLKKKRTIAKIFKAYGDVIWDMTEFGILPEVIIKLKRDLAEAGYNVKDKGDKPEVGELTMKEEDGKIYISGQVYSTEDEKRIRGVLDSASWLVDGKSKKDAEKDGIDDDRVSYALNLQVDETMLQVDVLHVAVNEEECKRIGIDWNDFFETGANIAASAYKVITHDPIRNEHYSSSSFNGGVSITGVLGLLGKNDIHRIRRSASMTFKNNGKAKMHNGGSAEINNTNTGGNNVVADTKTVTFGLQMEVSGGLTGKDRVNLDLSQSVSYPLLGENKLDNSFAYQERKSTFSMPLQFKLGEAIAFGCSRDITQDLTNTGSLPYVRHIPFLKWLVSQSADEYKETRIITLICVRKLDAHSTIDPVTEQLEKMHLEDDMRQAEHDEAETKAKESKWYDFLKW